MIYIAFTNTCTHTHTHTHTNIHPMLPGFYHTILQNNERYLLTFLHVSSVQVYRQLHYQYSQWWPTLQHSAPLNQQLYKITCINLYMCVGVCVCVRVCIHKQVHITPLYQATGISTVIKLLIYTSENQ